MRRVRYAVGVSLDGYIAGPAGELDYLVSDPAFDQREFFMAVDTGASLPIPRSATRPDVQPSAASDSC